MFREYAIPFILAVLVHGCVAVALWAGWQPAQGKQVLVKPQAIQAQLIQLESKPRKQKKNKASKPKPPARKIEIVQKRKKPKAAPEKTLPTAEDKKLAEKKQAAKQEKDRQLQEQLRQKRIDTLLTDSFDLALAEESEALAQTEEAEAVQSFAQNIRQLIMQNWSRPPSARNGMQAKLLVELIPTGNVVSVTVLESSGNAAFDRSAEVAVRKVRKFTVPQDSAVFEKNFRKFYLLFKPEDLLR